MSTYDDVVFKSSLTPSARTATANGTAIDRGANGGMQDAVLLVTTGTITDATHAITVEDSDDGSTGWVAVPAGQLQSGLPTVGVSDDNVVFEVGIRATRRYIRAVTTVTGATTGGVYGVGFILGQPRTKPVSHP